MPKSDCSKQGRNSAHALLSAQLRLFLDPSKIEGNYLVSIGKPFIDQQLDRVLVFAPDPEAAARRADVAFLSHSHEQPSITLIDVTMAVHNSQHVDPDYHPGSSAVYRASQKHASVHNCQSGCQACCVRC